MLFNLSGYCFDSDKIAGKFVNVKMKNDDPCLGFKTWSTAKSFRESHPPLWRIFFISQETKRGRFRLGIFHRQVSKFMILEKIIDCQVGQRSRKIGDLVKRLVV